MLIIYRTNEGFGGQIASLDRVSTRAEFEAWQQANGEPLAYVELDELLAAPVALELLTRRELFSIANGRLQKNKSDVQLDYRPGDAEAAQNELRGDTQIKALLTMTPVQVGTWIDSKTTKQALLVILQLLQQILRAARLMAS